MEAVEVFDMTCQEFWNSMPELGAGDGLPEHVLTCVACAARFEQQRVLADSLGDFSREWANVGAPARVESRLVAAFRAQSGLSGGKLRQWPSFVPWMAAAAAAAGFAFFLVRGREPVAVKHGPPAGVQWAGLQTQDASLTGDAALDNDDFIPLPNAARIAPNEEVNLVRLELPRSAMIPLGYEVSAERASEPVEAEVVLGADGLARAVRFLDE